MKRPPVLAAAAALALLCAAPAAAQPDAYARCRHLPSPWERSDCRAWTDDRIDADRERRVAERFERRRHEQWLSDERRRREWQFREDRRRFEWMTR